MKCIKGSNQQTLGRGGEDDSKIGGSRVNFPLHLGETPTQSTEKQSQQPTVPQCL